MEQEWRSRAGQDLVRVGIERDDSGLCRTALGFGDEVLEQVRMTAMQPIEDPDDREDGAVLGPQAIDPGDDVHHAGTAGPAGVTRTLSGARRPWGASTATAASTPSGARSRYRSAPGSNPAAGRMNWPRATASSSGASGSHRGSAPAPCRWVAAGGPWRPDRRRRPRARCQAGSPRSPGTARPPSGEAPRGTRRFRAAPRGRARAPGCTSRPNTPHRATATGRSGSLPSQEVSDNAWIVTSRSASVTTSPARAIA